MNRGSLAIACAVVIAAGADAAHANQEDLVLDRARVIQLVRDQSPSLRAVRARAAEARAARAGAGAAAPTNPELAASAGPRFLEGSRSLDLAVSLSWPFDLSGAPGARVAAVDQRVAVAEAVAREAERDAVADALDAWTRARGAEARLGLERKRARLGDELLRIARVRSAAGAVGDGDVALSELLGAEACSRLRLAEAEQAATLATLRGRLGLDPAVPLSLPDPQSGTAPPQLEALLQRLDEQPELARALALSNATTREADLERRVGLPVPRLVLIGERSPESTFRAGFDVALPVYQRNLGNAAVAEARSRTAGLEQAAMRVLLDAGLRAAHARLRGADAAYQELARVAPAIDDAEQLATRGYQLGQGTLAGVVSAHREAASTRAALLDAREALERARIVVDLAFGAFP